MPILKRRSATPAPSVPAGVRLYAIGDVHGRLDLLDRLLDLIDADHRARAPAAPQLVLLGDLIDRGPASRQVIDRVMQLSRELASLKLVMGNHEEVFLGALEGDAQAFHLFRRIGGRETMLSYGITAGDIDRLEDAALMALLADRVPTAHADFLRGFDDIVIAGDYAFVHAGIAPGRSLDAQRPADLRWIRDRFLGHGGPHPKIIVHGHSVRDSVEERGNRIGIDTGAYASGRLTAIGLEGTERWFLST